MMSLYLVSLPWSYYALVVMLEAMPKLSDQNRASRFNRSPSLSGAASPGLGIDAPELQQARALWAMNRFDESLEMFEKAVSKYPQNLIALIDASRALGTRFELARAEALLD